MGRFRFGLQPALDVACATERDAGVATLRAVAMLAEARGACEDVRARRRQARALAATPESRASLAAIASDWYAESLRVVAAQRERARLVAERGVASARVAYEHARGRRIALERIRERRLAEHRALAELREASAFDEANARRFAGAAFGSQVI